MTEENKLAKERKECVEQSNEFFNKHGVEMFKAIREIIDLKCPKEEHLARLVKLNLVTYTLVSIIYDYFPPSWYERVINCTLQRIRSTLLVAEDKDG